MTKNHPGWKEWLAEGRVGPLDATLALLALYCLVQAVALTLLVHFAGTGVGIDDAEQLVYLPYLWAGYGGSQPPIYTWINHIAASALGINVLTLKLVKYTCLFIAALSVHVALRRLGLKTATAATATWGLFLIPQIFWETQRALSHSVAALCFSSLAILAFAHLYTRRTALAYALFGLAMAGAILAKYNDFILLGALLGAALSLGEFRRLILNRRFLLTVVVTCLAIAPTLIWNAQHPEELLARSYKFGIGRDSHSWNIALTGLYQVATSAFYFSLLPLVVLIVATAITWHGRITLSRSSAAERLLWRTVGLGLGIVTVFVLASGATEIRDRWFLPILFLFPAAVAATMERFGDWGRAAQLATIRGAVFVLALATPGLWYAQIYTGDGQSRIARLDYPALERALFADGPAATILSDKLWIGNLRLVNPDLVLLGAEVPDFTSLIREPAILVWMDSEHPDPSFVQELVRDGYVPSGSESTVLVREKVGDGVRQVGFVPLRRFAPSSQAPAATGMSGQ